MFIATYLIDGIPAGNVGSHAQTALGAAQELFKAMNGVTTSACMVEQNTRRSMMFGDQARVVNINTAERWLFDCEETGWCLAEYGTLGVPRHLVDRMLHNLDDMQATWILGGVTRGFGDAIKAYSDSRDKVEQAIAEAV